jgi:hypothetical protein
MERQTERDHYEDMHRWEDSIKTDLREVVFGGIDWIHLAHNT